MEGEDQNQDFLPIQTSRDTSWFWQLPCHAVFFCCPQKSACLFPFSLLSPVVSNQSTFVMLPCICVSEVSMLMFLLLVRKRMYSRNKKRSFICLCNKDSPLSPPSQHFRRLQRGELYITATYISEKNQIGVIVDFLSLELGRGNTWSSEQDCASEWEG